MVARGSDEGSTTSSSEALLNEIIISFHLNTIADVEKGGKVKVVPHPVSELIWTNPVCFVEQIGP